MPRTLLFTLHGWALRLLPLHGASLAVAATGTLTVAGLLLFFHDAHAPAIRLALIVTMWALMLAAFINVFRRTPPVVLYLLPLHEQVTARMQRLLYRAVALGYLLLLAAVAVLSFKLLLVH